MQLHLAAFLGPKAFRLDEHHHNEQDAVHQKAVIGEFPQHFWKPDEDKRADHHAGDTANPADDDKRQRVNGN